MARVKHFLCEQCGDSFYNTWPGSKFCSNKCRQKHYRNHKTTVTGKSKPKYCIRCGNVTKDKSKYCSKSCKTMTNREKQRSTLAMWKTVYGNGKYEIFVKNDSEWKGLYAMFEKSGYVYDAHLQTWHKPDDQLRLPFSEE